jgi:HEAT repeat protein
MGDESDLPWLIGRLKGEDHHVRGAAAIAIGMIGDPAAVEPLVKLAKESPKHRAFAIAALGCLVDRSPLPRIGRILRNIHYRKASPILREVLSVL